ncbi:uncharacterized protein LOC113682698 [Pocillopora damicornis]|uniref:uncharacterized protein LOC113682698 n=1 Tax=Pocillopora damicornis TaxID=46731 RepID=UPI000F5520E2|nr:uncharacterized protein LOC113682698 [Pocillopora damicornis]
MTNNTKVLLTCKNLLQLPRGRDMATIECAPSTSLHVTLSGEQSSFRAGWKRSGFECRDCDSHHVPTFPHRDSSCADCSLCSVGNYTSETGCVECPAVFFAFNPFTPKISLVIPPTVCH